MNGPLYNARMNKRPDEEGSFNVDDLVKRIDAKIAELEEEERREKEEEEKQQRMIRGSRAPALIPDQTTETPNNVQNVEIENTKDEPLFVDNSDNIINSEPKEDKINIDDLNKSNDNLYIDDTNEENFFDDFFYDEE